MTDQPFKLRVLYALTDVLKTITPEDGYTFDLSDFDEMENGVSIGTSTRVFRGRPWFGDSDPIPMLSILEGLEPGDPVLVPPANMATGIVDWGLNIQGFVTDDKLHPTDPAYMLLADVRRRLALEKVRRAPGSRQVDPLGFGLVGPNRVLNLSFGSGVVRPADDISAKAYFYLNLVLQIVEAADLPFS